MKLQDLRLRHLLGRRSLTLAGEVYHLGRTRCADGDWHLISADGCFSWHGDREYVVGTLRVLAGRREVGR